MQLSDETSLYAAVTNAARFLFAGGVFTAVERADLITWILSRPNRRRGFIFHPTPDELAAGIRLLSGERARTQLLAANAVELETLRLLTLLQPESPAVQQLCTEAEARLAPLCFANICTTGECAHASIAVLRYWTARDLAGSADRLGRGLAALGQDRRGDGRWRRFPFYFTLLWLVELPAELAREELTYAAAACTRLLRRSQPTDDPVGAIRENVLRRALQS